MPAHANRIPSPAPPKANSELSARSCRTKRERLAPSAARTANSRPLAVDRASRRLATFAQPISSRRQTAANSTNNSRDRRTSPECRPMRTEFPVPRRQRPTANFRLEVAALNVNGWRQAPPVPRIRGLSPSTGPAEDWPRSRSRSAAEGKPRQTAQTTAEIGGQALNAGPCEQNSQSRAAKGQQRTFG